MNPILYWNAVLLEASRRDFTRGFNNAQQPGPIRTSRAMAIVHVAIHDVVALRQQPGAAWLNKKGIGTAGITIPNGGDIADQIAGAAVTTLKAMYPRFTDFIDDATGPTNPADFAFGVAVGNAMLAARAGDGSDTMVTTGQVADPSYGQHRADPYQPGQNRLGPVWGEVKRFTGQDHQALDDHPGRSERMAGHLLTNAHYREDFEEVRDLGSVVRGDRTAEQQRIGVYWGYDGANNLGVPPRLYNQVARRIIQGRTLTLAQVAELFATINVAMADAGIDAWHYKYKYDLWRPVVGIRTEDAAGGGDPFWAPLGAPQTNTATRGTYSPNFPAYPSGHATFGAALMQVLRLKLNAGAGAISVDEVLAAGPAAPAAVAGEAFSFVSDELDGIASDPDGSTRPRVEKQFVSFAQPVWENAVSRVYLGVHWRFDGLPRVATDRIGGVPLGLAVGQEAHSFFNTLPSLAGSA